MAKNTVRPSPDPTTLLPAPQELGVVLPPEFYAGDDVVKISKALLGKVICTAFEGGLTSAIILETEAYNGRTDKACHAHLGRRTHRTEVMYQPGGLAYVYLCYGLHHLFNIVTNKNDFADAILIRAAQPLEGVEIMARRRKLPPSAPNLLMGPGSFSQALGISSAHWGQDLQGPLIWLEDRGIEVSEEQIATGVRIGIDYAEEDRFLPWRFWVRGNPYVSRPRKEGVPAQPGPDSTETELDRNEETGRKRIRRFLPGL